MAEEKNIFQKLYDIDISDRSYDKQGLTYIPWAVAFSEVAKVFPDVTYEIKKFGEDQLPYVYDERAGIMVYTSVTISGITREMCLPVMNGANKAMKFEPYEYTSAFKGKETVKKVEAATMFDVNKTIMRCLAKNLAMFGVGLYLWTKDGMPEIVKEIAALQTECMELIAKKSNLSENAKAKVAENCKKFLPDENGDPRLSDNDETLKSLKKALLTIRK